MPGRREGTAVSSNRGLPRSRNAKCGIQLPSQLEPAPRNSGSRRVCPCTVIPVTLSRGRFLIARPLDHVIPTIANQHQLRVSCLYLDAAFMYLSSIQNDNNPRQIQQTLTSFSFHSFRSSPALG